MTTGALIFAFNNEQTDYVRMAAWSADNIRRHLNIPVAVVTDCTDNSRLQGFDKVIFANSKAGGTRYFEDYQSTVTWHNAGRVDAYNLTPWEQTLVLDADYVVASNSLKSVLHMPQDFTCHDRAWDLTLINDFIGLNRFGEHKMPMWWATVMMFRKSNTAQYIFDCMHMVRENWQHYRDLYSIQNKTYRNDFALSIALGIVNGHTQYVDNIGWPLASVLPECRLECLDSDYYVVHYKDHEGRWKNLAWAGMDFHAMGKQHLEKIIASS